MLSKIYSQFARIALQVQSLQKQLNALAEKQGISLSVPDTSPLITQTLSSKVINKNQVQLTWNAIPEASHYRVYRKNTYTSEFDLIANLSANPLYGTTFNASWYPCGTHTFYLQTVNAKGVELASSNQVEVSITEGCPTVPVFQPVLLKPLPPLQ
jgi:fibronectin type 3 domain-containing protein